MTENIFNTEKWNKFNSMVEDFMADKEISINKIRKIECGQFSWDSSVELPEEYRKGLDAICAELNKSD